MYKKGVLKNFTNFTSRHLCLNLFFTNVAGFRPATLLKNRLRQRCFPVNVAKFLRTRFSYNTSGGCFCIDLEVHDQQYEIIEQLNY